MDSTLVKKRPHGFPIKNIFGKGKNIAGLNDHSDPDLRCYLQPLKRVDLGLAYQARIAKADELQLRRRRVRLTEFPRCRFQPDCKAIRDLLIMHARGMPA
jgi:hypothetical protein